jgi:hypothetical protein
MNSPDPINRKPGGQLGNTNAIKHGFYSPRFRQIETDQMQKIKYAGVTEEIEMLRKSIRRVVEWSEDIQSLPDALSYLRVLSFAAISLSRLVRAQQIISDSHYEMFIGRAVSEISAAVVEADPSEESDESDPTIQWAKCDPPEDSRPWYSPRFLPENAEGDEDD